MKRLFSFICIIVVFAFEANAQIVGRITDELGFPISKASAMYKGHHVAVISDNDGRFSIARKEGWSLTFSSVGFASHVIKVDKNTPSELNITLKEDSKSLGEVVVKTKRERYSRKDNPAVELMRRVIAAKKRTDLDNHDYYQFDKYQKITFAINDISPEKLATGAFAKQKWATQQVELSPYNGKLVLPVSVDETVSQRIYRKNPKTEKTIIKGQRSEGLNNVLQTGEILNTMLKEIFTDVDIYDDHVRLLQYHFASPIGATAISFYRFYIADTVYVDNKQCYHLEFMPNNQQDFGFRGDLYVLTDSTLHVKKCSLTLPKKSGVNFVDNLKVEQEFSQLDNGEWVLSKDDMYVELSINDLLGSMLVTRTTRLNDYAFEELPDKVFKGKANVRHEADAMIRDDEFWTEHRAVDLTKSEASMDDFIRRMQQSKNYKWVIVGVRALMENYVETGSMKTKSKFDFGPVNTLVSNNFIDGYRFRLSGRTTGNLNRHLFWNGYYAYGVDSKKHYYGSEITYSLNKKKNVPFEFPQRNIIFETAYDVMSPSDKFLLHNKDNVFMAFRTQKVEQMYFYNRQKLSFVYETDWGLSFDASVKAESNEPTGDLIFKRLPDIGQTESTDGQDLVRKIRTTEFKLGLKYCPGQTFINTKQNRWPVNLDSPELTVSHTMGVKNILGGQYKLNLTEAGIYKRFWLASWGYIDAHLKGGIQWDKVPYPLLIMPPVNLSYFEHENTFSMMRNMEFITDRYAFWAVAWDLNGKLLNRLPLIKHLKWREYFAVKGMWGMISDKNNPYLERNAHDPMLFAMPDATHVMDKNKPYWEVVVGVHNIFRFFGIDYVRRLSYTDLPDVKKNGVRFSFAMSF